ncbi:hypothetical protein MMC07_002380 [Pseudocyphellaria aurata]|nr:hypothetical protein [Pseudocyphellaria aurata]
MPTTIINVLLISFPGLGLPRTLSIPIAASTPIVHLKSELSNHLPQLNCRVSLTNNSNKEIQLSSSAPLSSLLPSDNNDFLPLRLSVPLCGGKGGFGSQLRAAGGRMSSRRKKNQGEANSSNRNLDGRRLRTITEAKALAEYLAVKPEMEKREKEARRKRWEQVVDLAEKREHEIRNGSKGRVDGKWVEDKEEAGERTREAVFAAMKSGDYRDNLMANLSGSSGGGSRPESEDSEGSEDDISSDPSHQTRANASAPKPIEALTCSYFGFDEEEDFMSDEVEDQEEEEGEEGQGEGINGNGSGFVEEETLSVATDKGKAKA